MSAFLEQFEKLKLFNYQELIKLDEIAVQNKMAGALRAAAIKHLRTGKGVVAQSFRGEYIASGLDSSYEPFLDKQAKSGVWGTYIEATALAEMTGCTLVVTPVKDGAAQDPICLYRADNPNAPVIKLFNSNNTHWYVNSKTQGDGNCLFNAFAQAFQQEAKQESATKNVVPAKEKTVVSATSVATAPVSSLRTVQNLKAENSVPAKEKVVVAAAVPTTPKKVTTPLSKAKAGMFHHTDDLQAKAATQQKAINAAIQKHQTAAELQKELEDSVTQERLRLQKLPLRERKLVKQQIEGDYKLALKLALEEVESAPVLNSSNKKALSRRSPMR